jgi:hypothetical protein
MKPYSPHYMQLHSTIYLSRRQQFHVSAFSLRVRKRTQSGTIEFIMSSWRPCKFLSSLQSRNGLTLQKAGQQLNPDMQDNDVDDSPDLLHGLSIGTEGATAKIMATISLDDEDSQ